MNNGLFRGKVTNTVYIGADTHVFVDVNGTTVEGVGTESHFAA